MKKLKVFVLGLFLFVFVFAGAPPGPTNPDNYYVDVNVVGGLQDGTSWEDAFLTIQEGINAASNGDNVFVASGTYSVGTTVTPGYTLNNRIVLTKGIGVRATDGAAVTIIEGAAATGGGNGADAVRAVYMTVGTLDGFTITKGHTNTSGDPSLDRSGGGIYFAGGTVNLCEITGNSANDYGGAAFFDGAGTLNNSLLTGNTCADGGGVFFDDGGTMNNCTLSDNTATGSGGGAYLYDGGSGGTLRNSILWGNSGSSGNDIYDDGTNSIRYNCASDGLTNGVACTSSDPLFLDAGSDDYRIYINSPCFNTGYNDYSYGSEDLDGNDRTQVTTVDMGAYENAGISFTDGSSFTPEGLSASNNQAIGRFQLKGSTSGASLTDASIKLNGTRTSVSNIKLWASTNASFESGSDTQLGSTVASDPGDGGSATFSSFSSSITTSESYYFVTIDLALGGTGNIQGAIVENNSLTISTSGALAGTIDNAALSGSEVPTPITLASFVAEANNGVVELSWKTETETENAHFLIYRNDEVIAMIAGAGTTTEPHNYTYTDALAEVGKVYKYVLSDVSFGGIENKFAPVNVEIEEDILLGDFVLNKAYPNPFNPRVAISYSIFAPNGASMDGQLSAVSHVDISIYSTGGEKVATLYSGEHEAGQHQLLWDANGMPSGVYIVKMVAGNVMQSQKIVLMK